MTDLSGATSIDTHAPPTCRARLLIVDDSAVMRHMLRRALGAESTFEIAGEASNGRQALDLIEQDVPDAILLDVVMPSMDGLETLVEIRKRHPALPVFLFGTLSGQDDTSTALDALDKGASDYMAKPVAGDPDAIRVMTQALIPRLKALIEAAAPSRNPSRIARTPSCAPLSCAPPTRRGDAPARTPGRPDILVIGSSTGGPSALLDIVCALPANCNVPVLIVQHMPPVFTRQLAERLDSRGVLSVEEATDGVELAAGGVWVAPGNFHMVVERTPTRAVLRLHQGPKEQGCRPAVDVLLRSVAEAYGARTLAVILTGMGHDGLSGCRQLRKARAQIVIQDESTSVVWGMPGAVAREGLHDAMLPLGAIGKDIASRLTTPHIQLVSHSPRTQS